MSWLSSTSSRALRLTGASRSGASRSGTSQPGVRPYDSDSNLKHVMESRGSESSRGPINLHPGAYNNHSAWVDAESNTFDLPHMEPSRPGITMERTLEVSRWNRSREGKE